MVRTESTTNPSPMTQITVQLKRVCKGHGGGQVVHGPRDIGLPVMRGKRMAMMGRSAESSRKSFGRPQTDQETTLIFDGHV